MAKLTATVKKIQPWTDNGTREYRFDHDMGRRCQLTCTREAVGYVWRAYGTDVGIAPAPTIDDAKAAFKQRFCVAGHGASWEAEASWLTPGETVEMTFASGAERAAEDDLLAAMKEHSLA